MKGYGTWKGTPREQVPWYPTVDPAACAGCRKCFEFCSHGVYGWDEAANTPKVLEPFSAWLGAAAAPTSARRERLIPSSDDPKEFVRST